MSTEEFTGGALCRQRFKGIENFLKRVAFNLGNTPSQTEVKIISCIPIDVTDLQQKIIHLEKQLDEAKSQSKAATVAPQPGKPAAKPCKLAGSKRTAVNTALLNSNFPCVSTAAISCKSLDCDRSTSPPCSHSKKKSNVSFIVPADCKNDEHLTPSNENSGTSQGTEEKTNFIESRLHDRLLKMCEPKQNENRRNFFKKKKKLIKNKKGKSPYVYYAQTNSSPFYKSDLTEEVPKQESDVMSRSYLARMINKQYKPKILGDNLSRISQFSNPICRDDHPNCMGTCRYESDICSCCHGQFQNIDNDIGKFNNPMTYMVNEMNTGSAYYDTNQYDLVPVKEKPMKIKKELDMTRKKEPKPHIDMKCWPENVRSKYRYYSYPPPTNYQTIRPRNDYVFREKLDNYVRKMPTKVNRIDPIAKKVAKRRREIYKRDRPINIETSKSCSIDFGTVYHRKVIKKPKKQEILQAIPVPRKNAECLTTVINNSECQTVMSNAEANSSDAKTEATLNQIKSILQSVLAEVKVSSQPKSLSSEEKPKKDVFVQKGPSQSNMQASSLMNSITYSPYAMSQAPFMPSCSRQLNPSQFCYPPSAMKCFQNFPLFIQNPGRQMCATCYRNSSHAKPAYMKQATTIATNTEDVKEERSKETEKLIKEIYKSMALTADMPNKDTSLSEYDDTMKSVQGFTTPLIIKTEPKKQPKKIRNVVQAVSELFMKKDIVETSDTLNTTIESKLPSTINDVSTRSHLVTTDTELRGRKERLEKYLRPRNKQSEATEAEERTFHETTRHTATTITESDTSSSEAESDTTLVQTKEAQEPKQKKEKQGLFSKMFKSVKLFKPKEKDKIRKKDEKTESEEETSSDSDDYQTVYSQKIDKTPKHRNRAHNLPKRKTHSKISYKQTYQRDKSPEKKRSPYMEQEYRRYWDERLMFHDNKPKHSSERVYSDQTTPQKSAYYQTYEARNAFVEPKKTAPRTERRISRDDDDETKAESKAPSKGMTWLKKHKMGIHCGDQWKKLLLEG